MNSSSVASKLQINMTLPASRRQSRETSGQRYDDARLYLKVNAFAIRNSIEQAADKYRRKGCQCRKYWLTSVGCTNVGCKNVG